MRDEETAKPLSINAQPAASVASSQSFALKSLGADSGGADSGQPHHPVGESAWVSDEVGKKIPNILSVLRILVVPIFMVLLVDPTPQSRLWATLIFMGASFTDWLDGYLARIYKAESILGTLLDPLADKVLVMAALVMLAAVPTEPRVPAWIVVVLLGREFLVTGLRSLAAVQGNVVPASGWAKHKTAWTLVAITFLLIDAPYEVFGVLVNFYLSGMVFLWIATILSVATGIDYAVKLRKVFL